MSGIIESGAMARTTQDFHEDGYSYRKGMEFEVEEYATAEEAEASHGYYMGSNNGGGYNVEVREDHIELVRSRAEMQARTIPSVGDVAEHLSMESHGGDLGIYESDFGGGEGIINLYGTTPEGLGFAATVQVLSVERTDY